MVKRPLLVAAAVFLAALPLRADVLRYDTTDVVLHSGQSFDSRAGSPNPFIDVTLGAQVTAPSGKVYTVDGFFDGNGSGGPAGNVFKIRISPDEEGLWRWTTSSNRPDLHGKSGSFECSGTLPGVFGDGPIVIGSDRRQVFKHRDGRPVYLIGKFLDVDAPEERIQWSHPLFSEELSEPEKEALFARHVGMGLNKMNVYIANKGDYGHISTTPWIGKDTNNDKTRFDLGRWRSYEQWVLRMRDAGMVAQLWFFADDSQFGDLPDADRKRLIRYGMARLSGYVNTLFTLMLEWQEGWTPTEVATHAQYLHDHNPWDRLMSVHGIPGTFKFPHEPWADYMDVQAGNHVEHDRVHSLGLLHLDLTDKPLIQEEFGMGHEDDVHREKSWAAFLAGAASSGTGAFLKPLARFVSSVRFERLAPSLLRVVSGDAYAAEDPGRLYVVYLHGGPALLDLLLVPGPLRTEWFNPRTGTFSPGPAVPAGFLRTVSPPDEEDWVLTLAPPPPAPRPSSFYTVPPCRVVDTGLVTTPEGGPWPSAERRRLTVGGRCGVPASAKAVTANVTAVDATAQGRVALWPVDGPHPGVSAINFSAGKNRAASTVLPLGEDGTVLAEPFLAGEGTVRLILDVTGYFD